MLLIMFVCVHACRMQAARASYPLSLMVHGDRVPLCSCFSTRPTANYDKEEWERQETARASYTQYVHGARVLSTLLFFYQAYCI